MSYETELAHLVRMATTPGWRDHARHRAQELESTFPGITAAVRSEIERKSSEAEAKKCLG